MRVMPSRYAAPKAAQVKKGNIAEIAHISPPLKGLSLSSKLTPGDPLTAPILKNFIVEDDRIQVRAGYSKITTHARRPADLAPDFLSWRTGAPHAGGDQPHAVRHR